MFQVLKHFGKHNGFSQVLTLKAYSPVRVLLVIELLLLPLHPSPNPHRAPWDFVVTLTRGRVPTICVFIYSVLIDVQRGKQIRGQFLSKRLYLKVPKKREHTKPHRGTRVSSRVSTRVTQDAKEGGSVHRRLYCGFHGKKQTSRGNRFGIGQFE